MVGGERFEMGVRFPRTLLRLPLQFSYGAQSGHQVAIARVAACL